MFHQVFEEAASGQDSGDIRVLQYREHEAVYFKPNVDSVIIVFSTVFREETDAIFGKVFLQVSIVPNC